MTSIFGEVSTTLVAICQVIVSNTHMDNKLFLSTIWMLIISPMMLTGKLVLSLLIVVLIELVIGVHYFEILFYQWQI